MTTKDKARDKYYQRKYGIGLKDYNLMLKAQKNCCALCGRHESEFKKRLAVEHNHRSKKVRALCCFFCNKMRLGRLNLEWARKVVEYLEKYDEVG